MQSLLGPTLAALPPSRQAVLTGHSFFANLIAGPFKHGLVIVFTFALIMCLIAAVASWLRGAAVPESATTTTTESAIATESAADSPSADARVAEPDHEQQAAATSAPSRSSTVDSER